MLRQIDPADLSAFILKRRRVSQARTNPMCPHRSRCLADAFKKEVLNCAGCPHESESDTWESIFKDTEGALRLLCAVFMSTDLAECAPIELLSDMVMSPCLWATTVKL
ncbi:MAG: hypothetical protein C4519_14900 [Desulfobacteraceae bacterium]|nr:MAG: hypothetical protein C4519_14900 [Desulfobacteraceae bacterium]